MFWVARTLAIQIQQMLFFTFLYFCFDFPFNLHQRGVFNVCDENIVVVYSRDRTKKVLLMVICIFLNTYNTILIVNYYFLPILSLIRRGGKRGDEGTKAKCKEQKGGKHCDSTIHGQQLATTQKTRGQMIILFPVYMHISFSAPFSSSFLPKFTIEMHLYARSRQNLQYNFSPDIILASARCSSHSHNSSTA